MVSVISVSFKQAQFTLRPNLCESVQSGDFRTCFFLLRGTIFDLRFHFCLERYFVQTSGQMPGTFIWQIAGSWLSWWVGVMLIPPSPFSNYILQKEMWTPDGHPYLLHWGLMSHQECNECRGKHWQEITQWLAFSSAHHPLNISSNLFFCSPCPWSCAFSSATIILLMGEGKQKHWKMDCVPFAAPFITVIMVVGDRKCCVLTLFTSAPEEVVKEM